MIDTVSFTAVLDKQTYEKIISRSVVTQRIDRQTGGVEFEYDNCSTMHSYNYKVIYKLTDEYWHKAEGDKNASIHRGIYQLKFMFSVPKILWGHNTKSAHLGLVYEAMQIVKTAFEEYTGVKIPKLVDWYCNRLDVCANFLMNTEEEVRAYISMCQCLSYQRKPKYIYDTTGLYFSSGYHTLKMYAKGPEFKEHDLKRFPDYLEIAFDGTEKKGIGRKLYEESKKILRVEVEFKKAMKYMVSKYIEKTGDQLKTFQGYCRIADVFKITDWKDELVRIMTNLLHGTASKISESRQVEEIILSNYGGRQARTYIGIYYSIITQGEAYAKRIISKNMFYRAMRAFRDMGISLISSDVIKVANTGVLFPADFCLDVEESNKYYQVPVQVAA